MPVKRPLQPTPCSHCWLWRKEDGSGGSECTNGCALSVSFLATRHSPHLHPWLENSTFFWKCGCHSGAPNKGISPQKDHNDHHCVRQWVLVSGFWSLFCSQCPRHLQQDPIFKKSALIAEEQLLPLKKGIRVGSSSFFKKKLLSLFFAVLDLHCCRQAFSSCREQRLLSNCSVWISHHGDFSCGAQALEVWTQ